MIEQAIAWEKGKIKTNEKGKMRIRERMKIILFSVSQSSPLQSTKVVSSLSYFGRLALIKPRLVLVAVSKFVWLLL